MAPEIGSSGQQDPEPKGLGNPLDPETVASRADSRPPEEASKEDSEAQAQAILEESEERIADGAHDSEQLEESTAVIERTDRPTLNQHVEGDGRTKPSRFPPLDDLLEEEGAD